MKLFLRQTFMLQNFQIRFCWRKASISLKELTNISRIYHWTVTHFKLPQIIVATVVLLWSGTKPLIPKRFLWFPAKIMAIVKLACTKSCKCSILVRFIFVSKIFETVVALGKGGPVQIKWGGPFLYTLLYHVLSALAIKRNNAFYK